MDNDSMSAQEIAELQKKNCIFCKIIAKEIPSQEIYSDDKVSVFLDINPASDGHCLILPKSHYQILPQIPDDLIGYLFVVAKKTSRVLLKSLGVKGTSIFVANGAIAGQKAPHFMIHVMTRKNGDMLFELSKTVQDEKVLQDIKNRLAARLGYSSKNSMKEIEHHSAKDEPNTKNGNALSVPPENSNEVTEQLNGSEDDEKEVPDTKNKDNTEDDRDMNLDDIANLFLK